MRWVLFVLEKNIDGKLYLTYFLFKNVNSPVNLLRVKREWDQSSEVCEHGFFKKKREAIK